MNVVSLDFLKENNLIIVDKNVLLNHLIEVNVGSSIDKRVKWITKKIAISKYGVTRYWLDNAENNNSSLLEVAVGLAKNSTKKYLEQSIINEQKRQSNGV